MIDYHVARGTVVGPRGTVVRGAGYDRLPRGTWHCGAGYNQMTDYHMALWWGPLVR
jgi:hypothetical protein